MIKGTNTDCKITDISVVGSTATVTCLFFASNSTPKPVGLKFYLVDVDNQDRKILIENTTYWIDNINLIETDLLNVNVNGYKETRITIDITRNNTSEMQEDRWLRKCYLILVDASDVLLRPLWSSDILDLVSTPISIPRVSNLFIYNKPVYVTQLNNYENRLFINFKYNYKHESDFNYNNSNLKTYVIVKSISTGNIIEKIEAETKEDMSIQSSAGYNYNEAVLIEIYLTNLREEVLKSYIYVYKPYVKRAYGYIKTENGIKKIRQLVLKANTTAEILKNRSYFWKELSSTLVEGINKLVTNPNNLAIKVNYSTPLYAHYDREKTIVRDEMNETWVEMHKCVLHIDTLIKSTNFENVIFTATDKTLGTLSQVVDEDEAEIVLQNDANPRIITDGIKVKATYTAKAFTKSTIIIPNRSVTCSKSLKIHKKLHPFNYEQIMNTGDESNE